MENTVILTRPRVSRWLFYLHTSPPQPSTESSGCGEMMSTLA